MLFVFGRSVSPSLSDYFSTRAREDGHNVIFASMGEFQDSEPFAELEHNPSGELCVIFQSITNAGGFNASSNYMQMLACADVLHREGAAKIWGMSPLAGFMRQDKIREGHRESRLSELSGRLMREAGFNGLSTVEPHSATSIQNYEAGLGAGNVLSISPNEVFTRAINNMNLQVEAVANPDMGADERAADLASRLGVRNRSSFEKERNRDGTKIVGQHGNVSASTAMIDDIASTLGTASKAIESLYDQGSGKNILLISHPIMTGDAWHKLAKLIKHDKLEKVIFLPTFSRDEEFTRFKQQYGPTIASRIVFLDDEYNQMIYDHVTQVVAHHPSMQVSPA